jgi:hypothetical protein
MQRRECGGLQVQVSIKVSEEDADNGVGGMDVGALENLGPSKQFGGRERWAKTDDVVFGDL